MPIKSVKYEGGSIHVGPVARREEEMEARYSNQDPTGAEIRAATNGGENDVRVRMTDDQSEPASSSTAGPKRRASLGKSPRSETMQINSKPDTRLVEGVSSPEKTQDPGTPGSDPGTIVLIVT